MPSTGGKALKILVAVDQSKNAQEALRFTSGVGWPLESEIYLLHVVESNKSQWLNPSARPSSWDKIIQQVLEKMLTEARLFLGKKIKQLKSLHKKIVPIVVEGIPGVEILHAVKAYQIDLVILGTRGLSDIRRFLLGSTSDWVLREASCSVLVVRGKLSQITKRKAPGKVLLATDGSPDALGTADILHYMNFKTPPKLTVNYVVEKPAYLEGWTWGKSKVEMATLKAQLMKNSQHEGTRHLNELCQKLKELNFKVDSKVTKGNPADEILKQVVKLKTNLAVLGAKGLTGAKALNLGGVSRKVARYAPCSVLVVRKTHSGKTLRSLGM